jgi:hypothetical protein
VSHAPYPTPAFTPLTTDAITWPAILAAADALRAAGGARGLRPATIRSAVSDLRAGLARQLSAARGLESERAALALLDRDPGLDVAPLMRGVPQASADRHLGVPVGGSAARPASRRSARNARSRCRRLIGALVPALRPTAPVEAQRRHASVGWRPTLDALAAAQASGQLAHRRHDALVGGVLRVDRLAFARGVTDPSALPADVVALRTFLIGAGASDAEAKTMVWALRAASAVVRPAGVALPLWGGPQRARMPGRTPEERATRLAAQLPLWAAGLVQWRVVVAARATNDTTVTAGSATVSGPSETVLPAVPEPTGRRRRRRLPGARRPRTTRMTEQAVYRLGALVIDAATAGVLPGIDLGSFAPADAWTTLVSRPGATATATTLATDAARTLMAGLGLAAPSATPAIERVPAIIAVALWASETGKIARSRAGGRIPVSLANDVERFWSLTRDAYEPLLARSESEEARQRWALLKTTWDAWQPTCKHAKGAGRRPVKDKGRLLDVVTYPQVVACILPWYTLVSIPALRLDWAATREAAAARGRAAGAHVAERAAWRTYASAAMRWWVGALFAAFPLRLSNWWAARVTTDAADPRELTLAVDWTADGRIGRVRGARCRFASEMPQNPLARLKQDGIDRHERPASAVVLDPDGTARFLEEVWWPRLRAAVPEARDLTLREALESGRFPVIPGEHRGAPPAGAPHPGAYAREARVSYLFGNFLLDGARAMGREGLPKSAQAAAGAGGRSCSPPTSSACSSRATGSAFGKSTALRAWAWTGRSSARAASRWRCT